MSGENKHNDIQKYVFGPVASRRLGLSLGVDIIPFKVCPLDCVYCEVGATTEKTVDRKEYVPVDEVVRELKKFLEKNVKLDHITIYGSGEPTLHIGLGRLIENIKSMTDVPVAVLTNGVLFTDQSVRQDCSKADVVLPSLDAAWQEEFEKINRPYKNISIENVIEGLVQFRKEYNGQIWLEVFIIEGINTDAAQISRIKSAIEKIMPDKIQLNTVARPTADINIKKAGSKVLLDVAAELGDSCEIAAAGDWGEKGPSININSRSIIDLLRRRPCSLDDICNGLGIERNNAQAYIEQLESNGKIQGVEIEGTIYFKST